MRSIAVDMLNNRKRQATLSFLRTILEMRGHCAGSDGSQEIMLILKDRTESCPHSAETNPCAMPYYITILTSLTSSKIVL